MCSFNQDEHVIDMVRSVQKDMLLYVFMRIWYIALTYHDYFIYTGEFLESCFRFVLFTS